MRGRGPKVLVSRAESFHSAPMKFSWWHHYTQMGVLNRT